MAAVTVCRRAATTADPKVFDLAVDLAGIKAVDWVGTKATQLVGQRGTAMAAVTVGDLVVRSGLPKAVC